MAKVGPSIWLYFTFSHIRVTSTTYKTGAVHKIDKLLRLLHESIDTLVNLGHADSPDLTGYPPGVPMPAGQFTFSHMMRDV